MIAMEWCAPPVICVIGSLGRFRLSILPGMYMLALSSPAPVRCPVMPMLFAPHDQTLFWLSIAKEWSVPLPMVVNLLLPRRSGYGVSDLC